MPSPPAAGDPPPVLMSSATLPPWISSWLLPLAVTSGRSMIVPGPAEGAVSLPEPVSAPGNWLSSLLVLSPLFLLLGAPLCRMRVSAAPPPLRSVLAAHFAPPAASRRSAGLPLMSSNSAPAVKAARTRPAHRDGL